MSYGSGGKGAATGYTDFTKYGQQDTNNSDTSNTTTPNTSSNNMNMVQKRKAALRRRLLAMKGS